MLRSAPVDGRQVPGAPNLSIRGGRAAGPEAEQRLKRCRRRASTVVSKDELIQVDLKLATTYAVMGSHEPLLKIADRPVRQRHDRDRALAEILAQGCAGHA